MKKIPEWQYPLYKKSDKQAYSILGKIAKTKKYPKLKGSKEEINSFLKLLLQSQKMRKYRTFRDSVLTQFQNKEIDLKKILKENQNLKIPKGIVKSWVIFTQDKKLCELIDKVCDKKIEFQGNNKESIEFIIRFSLSQLLIDWRGPIMATLLECLKNKKTKLSKLNNLLKTWDYTKIF